ncbi:MAG: MerR family transcriptional regulator, partial [Acidobacteriaceae bacterium]
HNTCMRIGELAERADVNVQTLRFYEREGILRVPMRNASGYRSYEQSDLERVEFIHVCQRLGFTLREIRRLVDLHEILTSPPGTTPARPAAVKELVELGTARIAVIDGKIKELLAVRAGLASMVNTLTATSAVCPVPR